MKERPILFSGQMARAILDGRKTQTRRVVKNQPPADVSPIVVSRYHPTVIDRHGDEAPGEAIFGAYSDDGDWGSKCPYGEPGDRLWVRETWNWEKNAIGAARDEDGPFTYAAGYAQGSTIDGKWRPSIHMPRFASRITLEVTGVRVERLQEISEIDAIAEGVERVGQIALPGAAGPIEAWKIYDGPGTATNSPIASYRSLWDGLNAERGYGWDVSPWVWVVEFRRIA